MSWGRRSRRREKEAEGHVREKADVGHPEAGCRDGVAGDESSLVSQALENGRGERIVDSRHQHNAILLDQAVHARLPGAC